MSNTLGGGVSNSFGTKQMFSSCSSVHPSINNPYVNTSFGSCEGVEESSEPVDKKKKIEKTFIRDTLPAVAYIAASIGHLIAAIGGIFSSVSGAFTDFFEEYSLKISKAVNIANYTYKGGEALYHKRTLDGIARLAYSTIIPWVPLEAMFTYSGFSSGLTMMEQAQRDKIVYPNATEKKINGSPQSIMEDLSANGKSFKLLCGETFGNLWGKDRKVFIHPSRDEGHTMFLSAWGNILGAVLGVFTGKDYQSIVGKAAAIVRNAGSVGCDWAKLIHRDINNRISAGLFLGVSVFDLSKSFTSEEAAHTLSHLSNGVNNFANYYYVNTTKASNDGSYEEIKKLPEEVIHMPARSSGRRSRAAAPAPVAA